MNFKSYANKHKLVTFLIPEVCETGEGVSADTEGLTMKVQFMDERRGKHSQILVFADCSIKTPNM